MFFYLPGVPGVDCSQIGHPFFYRKEKLCNVYEKMGLDRRDNMCMGAYLWCIYHNLPRIQEIQVFQFFISLPSRMTKFLLFSLFYNKWKNAERRRRGRKQTMPAILDIFRNRACAHTVLSRLPAKLPYYILNSLTCVIHNRFRNIKLTSQTLKFVTWPWKSTKQFWQNSWRLRFLLFSMVKF